MEYGNKNSTSADTKGDFLVEMAKHECFCVEKSARGTGAVSFCLDRQSE